ncbi:16S rRNA (cytidine(1402)-2'-O)-methyltransferase [Parablautia intestinalis]|uniref:16S rRNA (cytidine(1402)-2'-O)-methyltransferase n=1 Tax=Parablautia intestinalis TaxID=2320100 RepID=UPI0023BB808A|nr:16S rRNA (cytidine(1402)-2'-O)-methyltransferase [Parablautia intestinalis]MCI8613518.1 16S rRNA (cytidine(1402)-2'-O)-methyltransferase [Lachnospiraceae bacterium]MDE7048847.1 16S rRNA (cytidine(1402)-2'-O)-methyltransferase [Lachnospiraceae bacterium]
MTGTLYLCATPIGNLNDITFRVLDTLREVDIIAAEDTRNSIKLLNHFEIKTPMTSYHEHNKVEKALQIISWLKAGKNIALITDAGTPAISDPGEVLVEKCLKERIPVTSLPGCCALITALTLSGISARRFCFEGFLPGEKKERRFVLDELGRETRTIILYEAPHHLKRTLGELYDVLGERRITLCRELTKRFETVFPTSIEQAVAYYEKEEPRGEYVLVIEGLDRNKLKLDEQTKWEEISIREHMRIYEDKGIDRKEAMKKVAADRGISKREVYQSLLC